jgi:segregation and condensation protein B
VTSGKPNDTTPAPSEPRDTERPPAPTEAEWQEDPERTVNLGGADLADLPLRDDVENPPEHDLTDTADDGDRPTHLSQPPPPEVEHEVSRAHLKGLLEALVFVSDRPIKSGELAKAASSNAREVKELLAELKEEYTTRGIQLDEVAGGWVFRTNAQFAPFVRDLTKAKPVRLTRAQVETLAILAYRQPITRPEIDDIRGVDSGATLKLLLERDLIKILGKKDEPGRPLLYGTTPQFLEFFGLKSLRDLPTLKEFTELNEDSRRVVEQELGDELDARQPEGASDAPGPDTVAVPSAEPETIAEPEREAHAGDPGEGEPPRDTLPPEGAARE